MISAQAAISLHNAQLYENLEIKIDELETTQQAMIQLHGQIETMETQHQQLNTEIETANTQLDEVQNHRQAALEDLQTAQEQLVQAEKLSTMGQMVAGIVHEINNPVNFISGSQQNLKREIGNFKEFLMPLLGDDEEAEAVVQDFLKRFDTMEECTKNIATGVKKITEINQAIRNHSRKDQAMVAGVELARVLDETLLILESRSKAYRIEKNYGKLPPFKCRPSQIGQVFTNLIANACDALTEQKEAQTGNENRAMGLIQISTQALEQKGLAGLEVRVEDNGPGIPNESKAKILEAFFTTKPPGSGTGLGLAVSHKIIKDHQGSLIVEDSKLGGACFKVWFPLEP